MRAVGIGMAVLTFGAAVHAAEPSERSVDPLLPTGLVFVPVAAAGLALGSHLIEPPHSEVCDVTGPCIDVEPALSTARRAHGVGLLSAGASAGVFGVVLGSVGAWRTTQAGTGTGPLEMLGMWLMAAGVSTAAMGVGALAAGGGETDTREGLIALSVVGALTTLGGGIATRYESGEPYEPRNRGMLYAGLAFATAAATGAGTTVLTCSALGKVEGEMAGLSLIACSGETDWRMATGPAGDVVVAGSFSHMAALDQGPLVGSGMLLARINVP